MSDDVKQLRVGAESLAHPADWLAPIAWWVEELAIRGTRIAEDLLASMVRESLPIPVDPLAPIVGEELGFLDVADADIRMLIENTRDRRAAALVAADLDQVRETVTALHVGTIAS